MRQTQVFTVAALLCCFGCAAVAKDHPTITIHVVDSKSSQRAFAYTTPGTAGTSSTTCDSNGNGSVDATTYGNNTYGNINSSGQTNCTTTSTPGTHAQAHTGYIAQEHIRAIMPNGMHVTLWCQAGYRRCASLQPGSYEAEITGGNTLRIYAHDLQGKVHKIKYRSVASDW